MGKVECEMGKDVVIIGGGIGGLVSGCLLCKEGYKVTVLEKHSRIGGGLHCFKRKGVTFETGIHYISGFQDGGTLQKLFSYLGINDKLKIKSLDSDGFDLVHFAAEDETYEMGIGKENFIKLLSDKFPEEKDNICRFIDGIYDICSNFYLFNMQTHESSSGSFKDEFLVPVYDYIASFTTNKKLSRLLAWTNCLYAGDRVATPIYIHALITKFYIEGASRFEGGSQQLADAMSDFISSGGSVLCSCGVTKIEAKDKKITKVITNDGKEFMADYYISAIHPSTLLDMIDPTQVQRSYRDRLHGLENTYSSFTVFIVLKPDSFPFLNYNYYYHLDYDNVWKLNDYDANSFPRGFMLTTPPEPNQSKFADKLIVNCVMNYDDVRKWEGTQIGKRGADYEAFKKACEEKVLCQVEKAFPFIRESIEEIFSATPLTLNHYTGSKEGSLYGYKKDCRDLMKSRVSPRTKLENLLLTGQNINLHGIIGVPLNAIATVGELVGTDYLINKINGVTENTGDI